MRTPYDQLMTTTPFVAAKSKAEAVSRLYAVAGAPAEVLGPGSKEKKSVLIATARHLKTDVDTSDPKDLLARSIIEATGHLWDPEFSSTGQTITLKGLNALLALSEETAQRRLAEEMRARDWFPSWFRPARDKLEVVRRIAALSKGRPQDLGPGSKERKSVLTDVVDHLSLPVSTSLSKTKLAAAISATLGANWDDECWSTGETLTLKGLNSVLAGVEGRLLHASEPAVDPISHEQQLLLDTLAPLCRSYWDGVTCVRQMIASEDSNARQTEWIGWYFEFLGLPALINSLGGGPRKIGSTTFDYVRAYVWDLKTHAQRGLAAPDQVKGDAPLNDRESIMRCFETSQSLGFLVLSGAPTRDEDGTFDTWHRAIRNARSPRTDKSRILKSGFTPVTLDSYVFRGSDSVDVALHDKVLTSFSQGRQQSGAARKPKLKLDLAMGRDAGFLEGRRELVAA